MGEMSLERACEVANAVGWQGRRDWEVRKTGEGPKAERFAASHTAPVWAVSQGFVEDMAKQLGVARRVVAMCDAAPPADAGDGFAEARKMIERIARDPSLEHLNIEAVTASGDVRVGWGLAFSELRALLAATERPGPGPGPKTRKVLELLKGSPFYGYARELRQGMTVDLESGDTALSPEHSELIAAALAENGMTEAPR